MEKWAKVCSDGIMNQTYRKELQEPGLEREAAEVSCEVKDLIWSRAGYESGAGNGGSVPGPGSKQVDRQSSSVKWETESS